MVSIPHGNIDYLMVLSVLQILTSKDFTSLSDADDLILDGV